MTAHASAYVIYPVQRDNHGENRCPPTQKPLSIELCATALLGHLWLPPAGFAIGKNYYKG
jgi:hypothetical protein